MAFETHYFSGFYSGDWDDPANWDLGYLPDSLDEVYLNADVTTGTTGYCEYFYSDGYHFDGVTLYSTEALFQYGSIVGAGATIECTLRVDFFDSQNDGTVIAPNVLFYGGSAFNNGTALADAFGCAWYAVNLGTATATLSVFNYSASNLGTVNGAATFTTGGFNESGIINGNCLFYAVTQDITSTINGDAVFYGDSSTQAGTINGDASFYDTSTCESAILGDAHFYESAQIRYGSNVTGVLYFHSTDSIRQSILTSASSFAPMTGSSPPPFAIKFPFADILATGLLTS